MRSTCHSEVGKIATVFIKDAASAFVNEQLINSQWKELNFTSRPDLEVAIAEYEKFQQVLTAQGAVAKKFISDPSVSIDSIYCRDASLATDHGVILCNMGKAARMPEPQACERVFRANGIRILGAVRSPGTAEGGDCAWIDEKTLAVGRTYRTNAAGIQQIRQLLSPFGVSVLEVPLPHYKGPSDVFHLMSIFSPVDLRLAVVYSSLMPVAFREELINRGFRFVEVPDEEFDSMGCNVLAIAPRECMMVKGNPQTKSRLEAAGCRVTVYDGSEISVKGGGGPTCLTRPMERTL
jgi:N-dimethylarginine dimethylaminohydrolase